MREGTCLFFNGTSRDRCTKGHRYVDVADAVNEEDLFEYERMVGATVENRATFGIANRIPCMGKKAGYCKDLQFPTDEEIAAWRKELDESLDRMKGIRKAILEHIREKGVTEQDVEGLIDCPVCSGKVRYSYAGSYNGHIHARCSTEGCAAWME